MTLIIFLSLAFVFFLSTSCTLQNQSTSAKKKLTIFKDTQEVKVYFTKSKKGGEGGEISLVSVVKRIPKEDSILDGALKELLLGPSTKEEIKGIMTEIPVGTRLIKVEESEEDILVDLSSQYLTGGGSATMQVRYLQLYKTLKNIDPYKKIYLQIDGKTIKAIGGEGLEVSQPLQKIEDYTKKYEKTNSLQP